MASQPVQKILRIGLFQGGKFIEERLIHQTKPVSVGQDFKKNTFVIPLTNFAKTVTLFDVKDGKYVVCFGQNMTGKISLGDGKSKRLGEIVKEKRAQKASSGYQFTLEQKMHGRIAFGSGEDEVAFLFQFVTPPPPRAKPVLPASMRGGVINGILGSLILAITCGISGVIQIGFVAFLLSRDWPKPRDIDYQIPDRFVKILVEEKKELELDPTEMIELQGEEGEPEEEKEEPGEPEEKEEPKSAEDRAAAEAERKRRMAEEVQNKTILSQLGAVAEGGDLLSHLQDGAGRTSMDEAFAESTGLKSGVAGEKSGLKSAGSANANGTGKTSGIGDLKGLKGAEKGKGGVKTGSKTEKKVKVRVGLKGPQKVVGTGKLDGSSISSVIKRRQSQIQKCYEREIKKNPKASGKVVVSFTIGTAGRVTASKSVKDSVGGGVGKCVANVIGRLRFKKPEGGEVFVNKTFVFEVAQ